MFLLRKEEKPQDLDAPETTIAHRNLVLGKPFLKKIYNSWYAEFQRLAMHVPPEGKVLEIGSGGGFLKDVIPDIITTDIIPLPHCDMTVSALNLPFDEQSLSAIFMLDVFHHLPDVEKFLDEAQRTLKPGGRVVMTEPANTAFARLIYRNLHHEPFDTSVKEWDFPSSGPLSDANGALPWVVFERDKAIFREKFPDLKIISVKKHTPFRYLVSGGLSYKPFLPDFMYGAVYGFEQVFAFLNPVWGMFQTIVLQKS